VILIDHNSSLSLSSLSFAQPDFFTLRTFAFSPGANVFCLGKSTGVNPSLAPFFAFLPRLVFLLLTLEVRTSFSLSLEFEEEVGGLKGGAFGTANPSELFTGPRSGYPEV